MKVEGELYIVEYVGRKKKDMYGHVQCMEKGRLPKSAINWITMERKKKRRSRKSWHVGVMKAVESRGLEFDQLQHIRALFIISSD